jgi:hypothetical protein
MLQYHIQQAIERWIEAGRHRDAIRDCGFFVLRYSARFRNTQLLNLAFFTIFLIFGFVGIRMGLVNNWKTKALFLTVFSFATGLSLIYVVYVVTSLVTIDNERIQVRCFGRTISRCARENVTRVYRSKSHPSLVIVDNTGKKTRISTQFDGLRAVVAWLAFLPDDVLDESTRKWMYNEEQDPDEIG